MFRLFWVNICVGVFAAVTIQVMVSAIGGDLLLLGQIVADRSQSLLIVAGWWACVCTGACRCAGMRAQHFFENSNFKYIASNFSPYARVQTKQKITQELRLY